MIKKNIIPMTLILALCSCAGPKKTPPRHVGVISIPGTSVPTESIQTIRNSEDATTYHFGRIESPSDPDFMLEETKGYRVETQSSWNLDPQSEYRSESVQTAAAPAASEALLADYEQRIKAMRDEFQEREAVIIEQNQALIEHNSQQQQQMNQLQELSAKLIQNQNEVLALKNKIQAEEQARAEAQAQKPWFRFWEK